MHWCQQSAACGDRFLSRRLPEATPFQASLLPTVTSTMVSIKFPTSGAHQPQKGCMMTCKDKTEGPVYLWSLCGVSMMSTQHRHAVSHASCPMQAWDMQILIDLHLSMNLDFIRMTKESVMKSWQQTWVRSDRTGEVVGLCSQQNVPVTLLGLQGCRPSLCKGQDGLSLAAPATLFSLQHL